jgi:hypothetical protein
VLHIQNRRDREARRDRKDRLASCERSSLHGQANVDVARG